MYMHICICCACGRPCCCCCCCFDVTATCGSFETRAKRGRPTSLFLFLSSTFLSVSLLSYPSTSFLLPWSLFPYYIIVLLAFAFPFLLGSFLHVFPFPRPYSFLKREQTHKKSQPTIQEAPILNRWRRLNGT